jgi:membrane protein
MVWVKRPRIALIKSPTSRVDHRGAGKGAALAFSTLSSITPILVLAIAVAGCVLGAKAARGEIVAQVQGITGPNGAQVIQAVLAVARGPISGLVATILANHNPGGTTR